MPKNSSEYKRLIALQDKLKELDSEEASDKQHLKLEKRDKRLREFRSQPGMFTDYIVSFQSWHSMVTLVGVLLVLCITGFTNYYVMEMFGEEFDRRDFKKTKRVSKNFTKDAANFTDESHIFDEFKDEMDSQEIELKD